MNDCWQYEAESMNLRIQLAACQNSPNVNEDDLKKQVDQLQNQADQLRKETDGYKSRLDACQKVLDKVKDRSDDPIASATRGLNTASRASDGGQGGSPVLGGLDLGIDPGAWFMMPCGDPCRNEEAERDSLRMQLSLCLSQKGTYSQNARQLQARVKELQDQVAQLRQQREDVESQLTHCQKELEKYKTVASNSTDE